MSYFLKEKDKTKFKHLLQERFVLFTNESEKENVITRLVEIAAKEVKIDKGVILKEVLLREKNLATGIANYLALPHAKIKIKEPFVAIAINKCGVNFDAADGLQCKIIILLLTPENNNEIQLQLLAEIAGRFKDKEEVEKLLLLQNPNEFCEALKQLS
ncbi:MAG: PTS sugar transporter subunit IIA [Ignavibacteria bacterium]|nr:PTS sugar transporter subunit IIA [Ignavibacteria bacterium]